MTESQINYFLAVAREKSISKASELLFVSQPAVSKQIALLESELGCRLFERHTRGLTLTTSGVAFEKLFLEFQLRFRDTMETAHVEANTLSGHYVLGAYDGWLLSEFCLDLFDVLSKKYPLVNFDIMTYSIDQIVYALKRGEVNHIIATDSLLKSHPDLDITPICQIDTLLMFSASDERAEKSDLSIKDFANSTFYITTSQNNSNGFSQLMKICGEAGFSPEIEYLPTLQAVYNKIQSNKGAFLTNEWIMAKSNPIFKCLHLEDKVNVSFASLKGCESVLSETIKADILGYYSEVFKINIKR